MGRGRAGRDPPTRENLKFSFVLRPTRREPPVATHPLRPTRRDLPAATHAARPTRRALTLIGEGRGLGMMSEKIFKEGGAPYLKATWGGYGEWEGLGGEVPQLDGGAP